MRKSKLNNFIEMLKSNKSDAFFFAALGLLVLSICLVAIALKTQSDTKRHYNYSASPARPFKIGQEVHMGNVAITLNSVVFQEGQAHFAAPKGYQYIIVDLKLKNRSDKPINIAPSSDTYVKDIAGHVAYLTPYKLSLPFRAGELSPGEQIQGQVSYLIAKNTSLKLYVDAIWSGGVLSFELK